MSAGPLPGCSCRRCGGDPTARFTQEHLEAAKAEAKRLSDALKWTWEEVEKESKP